MHEGMTTGAGSTRRGARGRLAAALIGSAAGLAFAAGFAVAMTETGEAGEAAGARYVAQAEPTAIPDTAEAALTKAKRRGDKVSTDLKLKDAEGKEHTLGALLEDGPIVLIFYRGGWCGYCTGSLRAFDSAAGDIEAAGARVFAVTPETVNHLSPTIEKYGIDDVMLLSDEGLVAGRAFGVAYRNAAYKHLDKFNGNDRKEIPLGVTYVIGTDGTIEWAWLDDDYRKRADPKDVAEAVKQATS